MEERIAKGYVEVGFKDREVERGLAKVEAEVKATTDAISRQQATVNIKYNVEDAKKALAANRAAERELRDEIDKREKALKKADATSKGGLTAALNGQKELLKNAKEETKSTQALVSSLEQQYTIHKRIDDQAALGESRKSAYRKADAARSRQELAEWKQRESAAKSEAQAAAQAAKQADRDARQAEKNAAAEARATAQAAKQAARDAETEATAELRRREGLSKTLGLQRQLLALEERRANLQKAGKRAQGSDAVRVNLDSAKVIADMESLRERLRLMGAKPIEQKISVDRGALSKVGDFFGFTKKNEVKDLDARLAEIGKKIKEARVNIGPVTSSVGGFAAALAALGPLITGIIGALGSLITVLGAGLAGALGLAAAGAAGFGLATLGMVATIKPFITQVTTAHGYLTTYNAAIAKYGKGSKEGQKATAEFKREMAGVPKPVRDAITGFNELSKEWKKLTTPTATKAWGNVIGATLKTVRADMGFFAKDTNLALTNTASGWSKFMATFRSGDAKAGLDTIFQNFDKSIPALADGFSNLAKAIGPVLVNFSNYLPKIAKAFDDWTSKFATASKDTGGFALAVQHDVQALKDLGKFTIAAGRFLFDFFHTGLKPGEDLVNSMTGGLNKLNAQMETVSGQEKLNNFFSRSVTTTKELWGALVPLVSAFVQFAQALSPIANIALKVVSAVSSLAAVLIGFKPLQYFAGFLVGIAIVGRLTSGLRAAGEMVYGVGKKLYEVNKLMKEGNTLSGAFKGVFGSGGAQAEAILGAYKEGSALTEAAIISGFQRGAALAEAGVADGGAVAATEIKAAEVEGGAVGGVTAGAKGGLGLLGTAARGVGIAGVGVLGAQVAGGAIGGKTGSAVSSIGTGVAIGAGAGSLGGPVAALVGGLGGGLVAAFAHFVNTDAGKFGREAANKFTAPFSDSLQKATGSGIDKGLQDTLNKANDQAKTAAGLKNVQNVPGMGPLGGPRHDPTGPLNAASNKSYAQAGVMAAEDFQKGWNTAPVKSSFIFIQDLQSQLKLLPAKSRVAAAATSLKFAEGMVQNGQMTKGAFRGLVASLETQIPGLQAYLKHAGLTTANDFANNFKFSKAKTNLQQSLENYRVQFHDLTIDKNVNGTNLDKNLTAAMQDLKGVMATGSKAQRQAAMKEYNQLKNQANTVFNTMSNQTLANLAKINKGMHGTKSGTDAAIANFHSFQTNIQNAMNAGVLATQKGTQMIWDALKAAMASFGGTSIPALTFKPISGIGDTAARFGNVNPTKKATGGRVPGPVGPDNWTLVDPHGRPAAKVGGSELLVANRHTEHAASIATQMVYGKSLGQMVNGEGRMHNAPMRRFATGGTVTASDYSGTTGYRQDNLPSHPDTFAELSNNYTAPVSQLDFSAMGGLPYMTPVDVSYHGKTARLFKRDVGAGGAGIGGHPRAIDIYETAAQQLGFGGLDLVQINSSSPNLVIGGGGGAAAVPTLQAPQVSGGTIGKMVQGGLNKVVKAANSFLQAHAPKGAPGGGAGPGTVLAQGGKPAQIQTAMMEAANQILGLPYVWGGGHSSFSADGYDCSGAVSYVLHAAGLLDTPEATGGLDTWGQPGPGKFVTVGVLNGASDHSSHTMMSMFGKFFESGGSTSAGPHWDQGWDGNFDTWRHPPGLARGGRMKKHVHGKGDFGKVDPRELLSHTPELADYGPFQRYAKEKGVHVAGAFANGGAFTTNGPTIGVFGEGGSPETVVAIPNFSKGGRAKSEDSLGVLPGSVGAKTKLGNGKAPATHPASYLFALKPRDRIGGIGTDDLDQAMERAGTKYHTYHHKINSQTKTEKVPHVTTSRHTGSDGKVSVTKTTSTSGTKTVKVGPTDDQKKKDHSLYERWRHLVKLDNESKEYIQNFQNLETQISTVGSYMTTAASNKSDSASGYDPKTGKYVSKSWAGWKKDLLGLEKKHTSELRRAAHDVKTLVGDDSSATSIGYVRALQEALGQSISDFRTTKGETDDRDTLGNVSDVGEYISMLPGGKKMTNDLAKLNYAYSLAQGNNLPDNPGTATREDLTTLKDDAAAALNLQGFYGNLLTSAQQDPKTKKNWNLLTALSDAFNGAQSTYQGIQSQFTDAASATGPSQVQLFGAARQNMFDQFANNVGNVVYGLNAMSNPAVGTALQSSSMARIPSVSAAGSAPAGTVKNTVVHNHFQTPPPDAHSWSQGVSWELEHAI